MKGSDYQKGFTPLEVIERGKSELSVENTKKNKLLTGFTLIELIVVMAVFLLVIGTAVAIFISIVQHQKRILSKQELLNQTSYAIEHISKGLRMAKEDLTGDCIDAGYIYKLTLPVVVNGAWGGIRFINASDLDVNNNPACQEFFLDNSDPQNPVLKEIKSYPPYDMRRQNAVALTSTKLKINSINFSVNGHSPSDQSYLGASDSESGIAQPRVTISLDVKIQGDNNQPATKIQTTVSQRDLNK